ncbi:MAG TPA: PIN domain-containing protein [Solirubrobacterales bacterium]|jgi:predicted nucleic acid-binding protein|nr:PIN domain-containing protein [Solirubrobacterales bacterium]
MKVILDTSVLLRNEQSLPSGIETAISAVSIAELHFGLLAATDEDVRAERAARLGAIESRYDPLPLDERVARTMGRLQAAVTNRGGNPRRRFADLAIAATAVAHSAVLLTANSKDLALVKDLVVCREPA